MKSIPVHYSPENLASAEESYRIFCVVHRRELRFLLRVVNVHFRTATLIVPAEGIDVVVGDDEDLLIDVYVGRDCIVEGAVASRCWLEPAGKDHLFGVRFKEPIGGVVERAARTILPRGARPVATAPDPLAAAVGHERELQFSILDVSSGGMLLKAAAGAEHLFVGTSLNATVSVEGSTVTPTPVELEIESMRKSVHTGATYFGASMRAGGLVRHLEEVLTPPPRVRKILEAKTRQRAEKFVRQGFSTRTFRIGALTTGPDKAALAALEGVNGYNEMPKESLAIGAFIGRRLLAALRYDWSPDKKAVDVRAIAVDPSAVSPELVVTLIQMLHALVLRDGSSILRLPREIEVPSELDFEPIEPGGDRRLVLDGDWLADEYLNPMLWSILASCVIDHVVAKTQVLARVRAPRKAEAQATAENAGKAVTHRGGFVELKWTEQHFLAIGILPYLLAADAELGVARVDAILRRFNLSRSYFRNEGNWVSIAFMDALLDAAESAGLKAQDLSVAAARRFLKPDVMGVMYFAAKLFVSPRQAFAAFETMLPRFDRSKIYRLVSLRHDGAHVSIRYRSQSLTPKHRELCSYWTETFAGYINLLTGQPGSVKKASCIYDGDESCTYHLRWQDNGRGWRWVTRSGWLLGGGAAGAFLPSFESGVAQAVAGVAAMLFLVGLMLLAKTRRVGREFQALAKQSDAHQRKAVERYSELQSAKEKLDHRYREARLLEETSRMIHRSDNLTAVFDALLQNICRGFGYARAYAMIVDAHQTSLELFSGTEIDRLGSRIIVPLHNGPVPDVVTGVFMTGMTALIDDCRDRDDLFTGSARVLRDRLDLKSCAIVPIQAGHRHGLLIIEKANGLLTKTDAVLLKRAAGQVAVALDKQARIDQEVKLRTLFQRYVPHEVITRALARDHGRLDGELRQIACMFVDIRGFTKLSESISPHATLEVLNRFFGALNEVASANGGIIEKFLGDGALVSWGAAADIAADDSAALARAALCSARQLLGRLELLNEQFRRVGLPTLAIGMGLHRGTAIVGNVGSEERLEYTSIGSTVNMTSRLEGLCKEFGAVLVASRTFVDALDPAEQNAFVLRAGVAIRGFAEPIEVGMISVEAAQMLRIAA